MRVLIVRHPPVDVPQGLCYGQRNVPLATGWDAWAQRLADLVAPMPSPCTVLHSPLDRCRQPAMYLANACAGTPEIRSERRLLELDFGRWDGLLWNEVPREELDCWAADIANVQPGGGESVAQMYARAAHVLSDLRRSDAGSAVLLTHSGPIRCLLASALGMGPESVLRLQMDLGHVSAVDLSRGPETGVDRLLYCNRDLLPEAR